MTERYKGQTQSLEEAKRRVFHLRAAKTGTPDKPARQYFVTVPRAIAELMLTRTETWRWTLVDEGVLIVPVDEDISELPAWAQNGS